MKRSRPTGTPSGGSMDGSVKAQQHQQRKKKGAPGARASPNASHSQQGKRDKRSQELPKKREDPEEDPGPPPSDPSPLLQAQLRLAALREQMEFRHAVLLRLDRELDIVRAKTAVLEDLPVGINAIREDLDRLKQSKELEEGEEMEEGEVQ